MRERTLHYRIHEPRLGRSPVASLSKARSGEDLSKRGTH